MSARPAVADSEELKGRSSTMTSEELGFIL